MAVSKAQQASVNKYVKANYDRINVTFPKGRKDEIQARAAAHGESVNGFIIRAVDEAMERDSATPGAAGGPVAAQAGVVPPDKVEAVKEHLEITGETEAEFITRAVDVQMKRDKSSLGMGLNPCTGEKLKRGE